MTLSPVPVNVRFDGTEPEQRFCKAGEAVPAVGVPEQGAGGAQL